MSQSRRCACGRPRKLSGRSPKCAVCTSAAKTGKPHRRLTLAMWRKVWAKERAA